jgi:diguanylate cyclase (GGDEF)-like protein
MIGEMLELSAVQRLLSALDRLPRVIFLGLSFTLILVIGAAHYGFGAAHLSWTLFYLAPIALATWFVGPRLGALTAVLSAAATYLVLFLLQTSTLETAWNTSVTWLIGILSAEALYNLKLSREVGMQLSRIDSDTGAINARFFEELLEAEYNRAERYRFALTVARIHLDNFGQLQERLGLQAGDDLLFQFVTQLSETLRANDVVARLGTEEFVILLPQTNEVQAQQAFARLQPHMRDSLEAEAVAIDYRIAVLTYLEMPDTLEEVMEQAEQFLQSIQGKGQNWIEYRAVP